jgi:sporulation protein YlmC with PRC-barrel domain
MIAMLKLRKVSDMWGLKAFTDVGDYFGDVDEAIIEGNKLFGWKIRSTRDSFLAKTLGGAKGVIVPHQLVRAIGDIVIVSKAAIPSFDGEEMPE